MTRELENIRNNKKTYSYSRFVVCRLAIFTLLVVVFVQTKDYLGTGNSFSLHLYKHFSLLSASASSASSSPVNTNIGQGGAETAASTATNTTRRLSPMSYYSIYHHKRPSPILQCTQNCSVLYKSEEKRTRAMNKVKSIIDEIRPWRRKKDEKLEKLEQRLASARALIVETFTASQQSTTQDHPPNKFSSTAQSHKSYSDSDDHVLRGDIYHNALVFQRSYKLMEQIFKIFVYEEGEPPMFHYGPCKNIYSIEGLFINFMESSDNAVNTHHRFRTRDPEDAHVFFLPFSVVMILQHLFHPKIRDKAVLERTVVDYVDVISNKYPYWNRSLGEDHVMLSCHDWGPRATWYHPLLYFHSIRVLCNANTSENYNPKKDASIPEINLPTGDITGLISSGVPTSDRTILGFFAGRMHGHIRRPLLKHWEGKDKDLQVYENLPEGLSYHEMMTKSKYCICPSGYEVASPRIVEAIYAECVPVLISQNYVLPFSDVLNWDAFSVQISVSDIPRLKEILKGISHERYLEMWEGVKKVQRHFVINNPPQRYDVFHMIIHSIWLRRLNVRIRL